MAALLHIEYEKHFFAALHLIAACHFDLSCNKLMTSFIPLECLYPHSKQLLVGWRHKRDSLLLYSFTVEDTLEVTPGLTS